MSKELIEKLKDNKTPFGLLEPEEQECLRNLGKKTCMFYDIGGWRNCGTAIERFDHTLTYAIKPDYQPELEYVDVEICIGRNDTLGAWDCANQNEWLPIHCLPSLPDFVKFWLSSPTSEPYRANYTNIAGLIDEGKKVYARFRTTK